ncbi:hypothetical protein CHARACLAT_005616 [Characodon lateralis]|uniref:Cation efflux protein transmembrane domain-containing protein n=1 Tax=Characodon lateralis TaxID=208331 RepID=A0ABU7DXX3_9TELE|nr:hypothetical protein [Characodon lateralis]
MDSFSGETKCSSQHKAALILPRLPPWHSLITESWLAGIKTDRQTGRKTDVSADRRAERLTDGQAALTAYTYLTIFDLFSLITCLISSWVAMKKHSQVYSFGFERLEVLAVFASTVLVQLGALFILKESVERFVEQPEVHTGRLLVGTFAALFFNLLTLLSVRNKPFTYVSEGTLHALLSTPASSTLKSYLCVSGADLQRSMRDIGREGCVIPAFSGKQNDVDFVMFWEDCRWLTFSVSK